MSSSVFRFPLTPVAMANKATKNTLEAARAAALAAHAAAGLATAASSREAARLLRTAEALARAAVAVLGSSTSPSSPSGVAEGVEMGQVPSPGSNRRRRHRRKKKQTDENKEETMKPDSPGDPRAHVAPRGAGLGTCGARRTLLRHETLPISPSSSAASTSSAPTIGTLGKLRGLSKRPDLNDMVVRFLRVDEGTGRYVVEPVVGGEPVRVHSSNLDVNTKPAKILVAEEIAKKEVIAMELELDYLPDRSRPTPRHRTTGP